MDHPTAYQLAQKAGVPFGEFRLPADFHYPNGSGPSRPDQPYQEPPTWKQVQEDERLLDTLQPPEVQT